MNIEHRKVTEGPSREDLLDSLRLDTPVEFGFHPHLFYKDAHLRKAQIVGVERLHKNPFFQHVWKLKVEVRNRILEMFYSTNVRTGFICKTDLKLFIPFPIIKDNESVPDYHPLSNYEVMVLMHLGYIVYRDPLLTIVRHRLIRGIPGMTYPQPESGTVAFNADIVGTVFNNTWNKHMDKGTIKTICKFVH